VRPRRPPLISLPRGAASRSQEHFADLEPDTEPARHQQAAPDHRRRLRVLALDQQQDAQIGSEKVQGGLVTQALGQRNGLLQVSTGVFDQPFADIQAVEHVQLAGSEQLVAGLTETGQCL
jgi:hypothetical protein